MNIIPLLLLTIIFGVFHCFVITITYTRALGKKRFGEFNYPRWARRLYAMSVLVPLGTVAWVLCATIHEYVSDRFGDLKEVYPMIKEAIE